MFQFKIDSATKEPSYKLHYIDRLELGNISKTLSFKHFIQKISH